MKKRWLVSSAGRPRRWTDRSLASRIGGRGDRDEGRSQDPIAELVAAPDDVDDLAFGPAGAGNVDDRLVLARVERLAGLGLDGLHALALEQRPELAVDRRHALGPRARGQLGRAVVDGEVEVVGERQDLPDEVLAGQAEHRLALLARPAPVVAELGALALEAGEVLVGLRGRRLELAPERLDLGEEGGRRDVDLGRPFLGPGAMGHAGPSGVGFAGADRPAAEIARIRHRCAAPVHS